MAPRPPLILLIRPMVLARFGTVSPLFLLSTSPLSKNRKNIPLRLPLPPVTLWRPSKLIMPVIMKLRLRAAQANISAWVKNLLPGPNPRMSALIPPKTKSRSAISTSIPLPAQSRITLRQKPRVILASLSRCLRKMRMVTAKIVSVQLTEPSTSCLAT